MKLVAVAVVLGLATHAFFQNTSLIAVRPTYPLWYDNLYDEAGASLDSVACATGVEGLMLRGYLNFSQFLTYPAVGGIPMIHGLDSPNCGTCWQLTYDDNHGHDNSMYFTAINVGVQNPDGFTISQAAMDFLTNGNTLSVDGATVQVASLLKSDCGL